MLLTNNELQFVSVLWASDEPLTGTEIMEKSVERTWKDASLHTLIKKLLKNEVIREAGFKKEGSVISRTFEAAISCDEYYTKFFGSHLKNNSKTIPIIFSALLQNKEVSEETIKQFEKVIEERKMEK